MRCSRPERLSGLATAAVILTLFSLHGCTPSVIDGGFDSPMAASRLYAIERAAREGDTTQIRNIIEQLESDDPAVRMLAIGALERLTDRTYGYRHDDPALHRRAAVHRWREAYEAGEVTPSIDEQGSVDAARYRSQHDEMEGATDG